MIKIYADKGLRIGNFILDLIITFMTYILLAYFLTTQFPEVFTSETRVGYIFYMVYFLYYLIMESIFGKTAGKFLTKTIVVDKNANKPAFWKILLRSLFRFFPLDALSYLCGSGGFHDTISRTRVVLDREKS